MLEIHTMGKDRCQVNLCIILNEMENDKLIRKVTNLYHEFNRGIKELRDIKNITFRRAMLLLWRNEFIDRVDEKDCFNKTNPPEKIKSHLKSSLTCCIRDEYRRMKGTL